jgi:hypothetical protein
MNNSGDNTCNDVRHPAENVRDAWRQLTLRPLNANDPRYVDCSHARGTNVANKLCDSLDLHSMDDTCMHLLFTGYRGDGKTTELFQFMDLIKDKYRPLYFNAEMEFDLTDFRLPDFLLGIATAVFGWMDKQRSRQLRLPDGLLQEVADWFASIVEVVERKTSAELKAEVGVGIPNWFKLVTGKLVGAMKVGGEKRKEIRRELNQNLVHLIDKVDKLLSEAAKVSKDFDNKELVIIVDSLDRLTPQLAFDLFHTNGRLLCELNCHFVCVPPISLLYQPEAPLLPFDADNIVIMPMIPVRNRDGQPNESKISDLGKLLEQRFVPDKIIVDPENIMRDLILSSGGHLRDLVRLFRQACRDALREPDRKINERIAERVINQLGETYQRSVDEDDYEHLVETYKTREAGNNERTQRLIYNTVILVYEDENAVTWKDVHPALANSERFQRLLPGG